MIEMAVRDENVDVTDTFVFDKLQTQRAQPGARVENKNMLTAANFDARGISAVTNCRWAGTGNASSNTPKSNPHR